MTRTLSANELEKNDFFKKWAENAYSVSLSEVAERYSDLTKGLGGEITFFSSPGRAELVGNHTDHNNGLVLATTIDLDTVAAAQKTPVSKKVIINSLGYSPIEIDIDDLEVRDSEYNKSSAIARGILKGFIERGYQIGGFVANTHSNIFKGAGVSSSAAFELLICEILNVFYNQGRMDFITKAIISQYAENHYFGKPSGLMDQLTISSGGVNYMDFKEDIPEVDKIVWPFEDLAAMIINCGGDHSGLTQEYAEIKQDMKSVAKALGGSTLRQTSEVQFYENINEIKKSCGGRAVLRAKHFFEENNRVRDAFLAINNRDEKVFVDIINSSGASSYEQLQNCFIKGDAEQNIPYALKMAQRFEKVKALRVHGGGFAGTILVFVGKDMVEDFSKYMNNYFDKEKIFVLRMRQAGVTRVEV
ncbi:MAG: galactokinase family protein [Christensenellales bacterium]